MTNKIMETVKPLQKMDALILSGWIMKHYGPMSHLKLQKLLFYCDAYHLAYFNQELIHDTFEAWVHGPVCRRVYDNLKNKSILYAELEYQHRDGEPDVDAEFSRLTGDQKDLVTDVLGSLSKWTSLELETATHREAPWIKAREGYSPADKCETEIDKDLTREYYKREISRGQV